MCVKIANVAFYTIYSEINIYQIVYRNITNKTHENIGLWASAISGKWKDLIDSLDEICGWREFWIYAFSSLRNTYVWKLSKISSKVEYKLKYPGCCTNSHIGIVVSITITMLATWKLSLAKQSLPCSATSLVSLRSWESRETWSLKRSRSQLDI